MIRDGRRREESGEFEPAVAVRRAHHGNLDALIGQSSDTSGPFSFDHGPPFEFEAELAKEINRRSEVIDDDSYVVHPFERHVSNLQDVVQSSNGPVSGRTLDNPARITNPSLGQMTKSCSAVLEAESNAHHLHGCGCASA